MHEPAPHADLAASAHRPAAAPARSEFAATPALVVVHDPTATGAFELLARLPDEQLEERTLFRARPDRSAFATQHAALVQAIADAGVEVARLADLVGGSGVWTHVHSNPNQVYTRDPAITLPWLPGWYVAGALRKPIRRGRSPS